MYLNVKKLSETATIPTRGSEKSAGLDLYAAENCVVEARKTRAIRTGIAVSLEDTPDNSHYALFIYARSGLACKSGLAPANKVGVVDEDYRGEVIVALYNQTDEPKTINAGDRIAQLVIENVEFPVVRECEYLDDTERGSGGFGSTGK